jgi:predicted XRE-type DNA-binding protein
MGDHIYQQADGWADEDESAELSSSVEQEPHRRRLVTRPAASEHLRLRAELMGAVRDLIRRRGLRQRDAAALFGVAQPRVSDLVRGKLALFSIDTLVDMLAAGGVRVEAKLHPVRGSRGQRSGVRTETGDPSHIEQPTAESARAQQPGPPLPGPAAARKR